MLLGRVDILFFHSVQINTCLACLFNAFGPTVSLVAFDAFGDFFFACPKKKQKRALSNAERLAQRKALL